MPSKQGGFAALHCSKALILAENVLHLQHNEPKPEAAPRGELIFSGINRETGSGSVSSTRKQWLRKRVNA
jgi:hypothetical protein